MGVELASMGRISDLKPTDEVVQFSEPARQRVLEGDRPRRQGDRRVPARRPRPRRRPRCELFQAGAPVPDRRLELFFTANSDEEGSVARGPAGLAPDLRLQRRQQGHDRARRSRPGSVPFPRSARRRGPAPAAAVCKKLVKGLIEAVAGGVKADPSEVVVRPGRADGQADARRRGEGARPQERVGGAARTRHRRGREEQERASRRCSRASGAREYIDERDARFVNDRVHANIQKDGTFSVIPRIYGGVTSADDLIQIGEVAKKYDVPMVKVTGGQRIDLLGIKKEDLPERVGRPRDAERLRLHEGVPHREDVRRQRVLPVRHERLAPASASPSRSGSRGSSSRRR